MYSIPSSPPSFSKTGFVHFDLSFLDKILSGPVVIHAVSLNIDMPEYFLSFPDISKAINYFYTVKNCSHVPVILISSLPEFPDAIVILVDGRLLSSCLNQDCAYDPYLEAYSGKSGILTTPDDYSLGDDMDTKDCASPDNDAQTKGNVDTDFKDSDLKIPLDFDTSGLEMHLDFSTSNEPKDLSAADDFPHADAMDTLDSVSSDDDVEPKEFMDTDFKDSDIASNFEIPSASDPSDLEMSSIEEYPDEIPYADIGDEPDEKPKSLKKFISRLRK